MALVWERKHPQATPEMLGFIPSFLSEDDPRPAREQFNDRYGFAGGWTPLTGFKMLDNSNMQYPGDPETRLLAETKLRDETIRVYEHAWVTIIQPDGSFEISRLD